MELLGVDGEYNEAWDPMVSVGGDRMYITYYYINRSEKESYGIAVFDLSNESIELLNNIIVPDYDNIYYLAYGLIANEDNTA